MSAFTLSELHECWRILKDAGKMPVDRIPPAVQDALKELGVAEVHTQDVVVTERRKIRIDA